MYIDIIKQTNFPRQKKNKIVYIFGDYERNVLDFVHFINKSASPLEVFYEMTLKMLKLFKFNEYFKNFKTCVHL